MATAMIDSHIYDERVGLDGKKLLLTWQVDVVPGVEPGKLKFYKPYDERSLIEASPGDKVILNAEGDNLERARNFTEQFLNPLGIGPNREDIHSLNRGADVTLSDEYIGNRFGNLEAIIDDGNEYVLSPYYYTKGFRELAEKLGIDYMGPDNEEVVTRFSDKDTFTEFAESLGIDVGPYEVLTGEFERGLKQILESWTMGNKLYGRGAESASAMGHYPAIDITNYQEHAAKMASELGFTKRVLIQPDYGKKEGPSIIYRSIGGEIYRLGPLSTQILNGSGHLGNLNPGRWVSSKDTITIEKRSKTIAQGIADAGFEGDFGLDFYGIMPLEANMRPTGNKGYSRIHRIFGQPVAGVSLRNSLTYNLRQLRDNLGSLLITNTSQDYGVIPVFTGNIYGGEVGIVGIGQDNNARRDATRAGARALGDTKVLEYLKPRR